MYILVSHPISLSCLGKSNVIYVCFASKIGHVEGRRVYIDMYSFPMVGSIP